MSTPAFRQTLIAFDTINLSRFKGGLVRVSISNPATSSRVWSDYYSEIDQIDVGNGKIHIHTSGKLIIRETVRQENVVLKMSTFLRQCELFEFDTPSTALQTDLDTFQFDLGPDDELPAMLRISSDNGQGDILHVLRQHWTKC